jgi:hypothetical protein
VKLIDFDGLFDEKLTQFMEENKEKYTEKQWEDIIPKLYKKFGDTYVAKVKCTPKEYYAKMQDEELVACLQAHLEQDVPTPEFLCAEVERRDVASALLPMLYSDNVEAVIYAINLLGDTPIAHDAYFHILTENRADSGVRSDVADILRMHADEHKERVLKAYADGTLGMVALEILSRVHVRDERIYTLLLKAFLSGENTPECASYLAAYGDERALEHLLHKIQDESIGFVEFQELKYAIEALGGSYDEPRDFTADKDYLAVEAASIKQAQENELKMN